MEWLDGGREGCDQVVWFDECVKVVDHGRGGGTLVSITIPNSSVHPSPTSIAPSLGNVSTGGNGSDIADRPISELDGGRLIWTGLDERLEGAG
jgi:hypothetical protein